MKFIIPINPKAQMRARARTIITKTGKFTAMVYKHTKQKQEELIIRKCLWDILEYYHEKIETYPFKVLKHQQSVSISEFKVEGIEGYDNESCIPRKLRLKIYLPVPKSMSKYQRQFIVSGNLRPIKKPDLDNFIKHFMDCANGLLWPDDSQVVEYLPGTGKYYDDGQGPRWEVEIQT